MPNPTCYSVPLRWTRSSSLSKDIRTVPKIHGYFRSLKRPFSPQRDIFSPRANWSQLRVYIPWRLLSSVVIDPSESSSAPPHTFLPHLGFKRDKLNKIGFQREVGLLVRPPTTNSGHWDIVSCKWAGSISMMKGEAFLIQSRGELNEITWVFKILVIFRAASPFYRYSSETPSTDIHINPVHYQTKPIASIPQLL